MGNACARNKSSTRYILPSKQQKAMIVYWPYLVKEYPNLFENVWFTLIKLRPELREMFDINQNEDPKSAPWFTSIPKNTMLFFHEIILEYELEETQTKKACRELGARHADIGIRGFQIGHWLAFEEYLTKGINFGKLRMKRKNRVLLKKSWNNLIEKLVQEMIIGYTSSRKWSKVSKCKRSIIVAD